MMEQRLERLDNDIKALKASAPISGSLVKTYCYKKTSSKTFPDNTSFNCSVSFAPDSENNGVVELSCYIETWTNSPTFSQYNPIGAYINSGYTIDSNGNYVLSTSGASITSDGSTYEVRATAVVYGTLEGSIEIDIS